MRLWVLAAVIACLAAAPQKKKEKPPEVEVLEVKIARDDGKVTADGRVRYIRGKSARGFIVLFDFLTAEGTVVTTKKTSVEDGTIENGEERSFQVVTVDPVRAVRVALRASDNGGQEWRVANAGPYIIE